MHFCREAVEAHLCRGALTCHIHSHHILRPRNAKQLEQLLHRSTCCTLRCSYKCCLYKFLFIQITDKARCPKWLVTPMTKAPAGDTEQIWLGLQAWQSWATLRTRLASPAQSLSRIGLRQRAPDLQVAICPAHSSCLCS